MRTLFWLLAAFAAAVALVIFGRMHDSYVLFVYPPYRLELSLLLFLILAVAGVALLYLLARIVHHALALPGHVRGWRERRQRSRAQSALAAAMQAYYEGRYARAEKEAGAAHQAGASPGLAALIAARAAHQLRNFAERDQWLERASAAGDGPQVAQLVTRAELALEERDFDAAGRALKDLHDSGPRTIASQRMLLRAERGLGNWQEVLRIASQLEKRDAIAPAMAEEYKVQAYLALLARASGDRAALERSWREVPSRDQTNPRVAVAAARHAAALGAAALAREIIERSLALEWSAPLVSAYGELPALNAGERALEARKRIERAESWLNERPEDAQLLEALGRLCAAAELWGKAQSYLEASLAFEETRAAHLELARLAERAGRTAEAQRHFRRAAEMSRA
ncbi:MAG TPA: heme biosynthesis HemY N-terminal domain-containing protein [Burkholderiales bacterium]|nr:heme biosynthesis HemY N-terminal domain-containing protein [Burkholderiales bacterium]